MPSPHPSRARTSRPPASASALERRLARVDWAAAEASLEDRGFARVGPLLGARECAGLARLFDDDARFRSSVEMARHRFGVGHYRYFADPLPEPVGFLRGALYPPLAALANRWWERLGKQERFPAELGEFLERCRREGQTRPTPLLLRYEAGGYNRLHQDVYGAVAFPLQVTILLSEPGPWEAGGGSGGGEFEGGEFLLLEQRPRQQTRGSAIALRRGEAVIFPNAERPVPGQRGAVRAQHRHGVSEIRRGVRLALGILFHDAR